MNSVDVTAVRPAGGGRLSWHWTVRRGGVIVAEGVKWHSSRKRAVAEVNALVKAPVELRVWIGERLVQSSFESAEE